MKKAKQYVYRELCLEEADRISEIDARCYIKNAWRFDDRSGEYQLIRIDWTDTELPNGYEWHLNRYKELLAEGGAAFGCFDEDKLVGYATVGAVIFGTEDYMLLDQLFVSREYRRKHIGNQLFKRCADFARNKGARKLYLCAGSSEDTIAFYKKIGCVPAVRIDEDLFAEDPNDIQLEYRL